MVFRAPPFAPLPNIQTGGSSPPCLSIVCWAHMWKQCSTHGAQNAFKGLKLPRATEVSPRHYMQYSFACEVTPQKSKSVKEYNCLQPGSIDILMSSWKLPPKQNLVCNFVNWLLTWTLTVPWGSCTCSSVASTSNATTNPDVNLRGLSDSPVGSMMFALALWSWKRQNCWWK